MNTSQTKDARALLTEEEAADILGVKPQTLANWRCTRRYALPFVRVGKLIRYPRAGLDSWLESRTVQPAAVA